MDISPTFFFFFAGIALTGALAVVFGRSAIQSAFCLVLVFFAFAGMYALLGAHFLAALQVLVYAGAIMVLFIFVIMLLNADGPSLDLGRTPFWLKGLIGLLIISLGAILVQSFRTMKFATPPAIFSPEVIGQYGGNTKVVSTLLFSDFLLPFELTSILLLSAMVGSVAIAMRKKKSRAGGSHAS